MPTVSNMNPNKIIEEAAKNTENPVVLEVDPAQEVVAQQKAVDEVPDEGIGGKESPDLPWCWKIVEQAQMHISKVFASEDTSHLPNRYQNRSKYDGAGKLYEVKGKLPAEEEDCVE